MAYENEGIKYDKSIADLSEYFKVPLSTVQYWYRSGQIPYMKVGGRYWFNLEQVQQAIIKVKH